MKESYREDLRKVGYQDDEIKQIEDFLALMCEPAHIYVIKIFVCCRQKRKEKVQLTFPQIMLACSVAWHVVWKYGTQGRFGDVDDTTFNNWQAFTGVYEALGLGCPKTL